MYNIVTPWMISLKQMCDVSLLVLFILSVFSIMGHYLFNGTSYYRCRLTPEPIDGVWEIDPTITRLCNAYTGGDYKCPSNSYCGSPDMHNLDLNTEQIEDRAEVYYGNLGYDNVYKAFLSSIQVITMDNWADQMYKAQDSNNSILGRIYFPIFAFIPCKEDHIYKGSRNAAAFSGPELIEDGLR